MAAHSQIDCIGLTVGVGGDDRILQRGYITIGNVEGRGT